MLNNRIYFIVLILFFGINGCNSSPIANTNGLLYIETNKTTYSLHETIELNINNNTDHSVYFKYYDKMFVALFESKDDDTWKIAELIYIESNDSLNARILEPDSSLRFNKYSNWVGKTRVRIPYNLDGSLNFLDTLISNNFTIK